MIQVSTITLINYVISGALTILIPLLMLERNMNIAEIGVALSALPLVFLVARLLFAAFADRIGWSHIFLTVNWPSTIFSVAIYYFANSTSIFLVGKVAEGLRESSYWAVIRTAIYHFSPQTAKKDATKNNAIIWLATAIGGAFAGFSIAYIGFSTSLAFLLLFSFLLGIPSIKLMRSDSRNCVQKTKLLSLLDPRGRTRLFWIGSIALMFATLSVYPLISLLLPVYMSQFLGFDFVTIGILFLLYNLVSTLATLLSLKKLLNFKLAIGLSIISLGASFFLNFNGFVFISALLSLAFVRGYGIGFFEQTIIEVTKNSQNLCVDIGLIHIPQRIAEFASVLLAGFLVQAIGYSPLFIIIGSFFTFYALISLYVIKNKSLGFRLFNYLRFRW